MGAAGSYGSATSSATSNSQELASGVGRIRHVEKIDYVQNERLQTSSTMQYTAAWLVGASCLIEYSVKDKHNAKKRQQRREKYRDIVRMALLEERL